MIRAGSSFLGSGLPGPLPPGERVLWQGRPDWRSLAWRAYHVRDALAWFLALATWRVIEVRLADGGIADAVAGALILVPVALAAVALLTGLAWISARATVYTVTDRRVVIRCGAALPTSINLPFAKVASAALKTYGGRDGAAEHALGDIPLKMNADRRLSQILLWPHVRPWHLRNPEPMLRAVPDAGKVARLLGDALRAEAMAAAHTAEADAGAAGPVPTAEPAPVPTRIRTHRPVTAVAAHAGGAGS